MNYFVLKLLYLFHSFIFIQMIDLDCNYSTPTYKSIKYNYFKYLYPCRVNNQLNITSKKLAVISSAKGAHANDKSNLDVEIIHANRKNIQYFPKGLDKIFPNLSGISMCCNGLKELNQEDLKPFSKLYSLNLEKNDIEILEVGIFNFNLELGIIDLDGNKIAHIDSNVFGGLTKLTFLGLCLNSCINISGNSSSTINDVIRKTESQCNVIEFIALKDLEEEFKSVTEDTQPEFKEKVKNLEVNFQNSSLSHNSALKQRVEAISEWKLQALWNFKEQLRSVENSNAELLRIIKEQNAEIDQMSLKYSWMLAISCVGGLVLIIILIAMRNKFVD